MSLLSKIPHSKKIIFGLDRCLWPFTVEYSRVSSVMTTHTQEFARNRSRCLLNMKKDGSKLMIASRSSNPRVCTLLLEKLYPNVKWDARAIFNANNKIPHISKLVGLNEPFCLFDHDPEMLRVVKRNYGDQCKVFLSTQVSDIMYQEMEYITR